MLLLLAAALLGTLPYWLPSFLELAAPPIVARFTQFELGITRVQRADWSALHLQGFSLRDASPTATLNNLSAEELRVDFSGKLLAGDLSGLELVEGSAIEVELDLHTSVDAPDTEPDAPLMLELPSSLPVVNLDEVQVRVHRDDQETIEVTHGSLVLDETGRLQASADHQDRKVELNGSWSARSIRDLEILVDQRPLVRESTLDLSRLGVGELDARLQLLVGRTQGQVQLELQDGSLTWDLELPELELQELAAQLPIDLEMEPRGGVSLSSSGALDLNDPLDSTALLQFEMEGVEAGGWRIDSSRGNIRMGSSTLFVETLFLEQSEENQLWLEDANLPLRGTGASNWLERSRGKLRVEIQDITQLLEPLGALQQEPAQTIPHRIALAAELEDAYLNLIEGQITSSAGEIMLDSGRAWIEPGPESLPSLELKGQANVTSLESFGDLFGRSDWSGVMDGRIDFRGTWPELNGQVTLNGTGLVIEGVQLGELKLDLRSSDDSGDFEVRRLQSSSRLGDIDARMSIRLAEDEMAIDLQELKLTRRGRGLYLQQPAAILVAASSGEISPLSLTGEAGALFLEGSWNENVIEVELDVQAMHPEVLDQQTEEDWPRIETGAFEAHARLEGQQLSFETRGTVSKLALPGTGGLDLEWDVSYDGEILQVTSARVLNHEEINAVVSGSLPLQLYPGLGFGEAPLEMELDLSAPISLADDQYEGQITTKGRLFGSWRALQGRIELEGEELRLPKLYHPADIDHGRVWGSISLDKGLECEGLQIAFGELLEMDLTGQLIAPLDLPGWLEAPQQLGEQASVSALLRLGSLDFEKITPLLERYVASARSLRRGQVSGTVRIDGPLTDPELKGELEVADTRVRLDGGLPTIEALQGKLAFEGGEVRVANLTGTLGAAPFEVSGGASFNGDSTLVDLEISGDNLLLFRDPKTSVRADTQLNVSGSADDLLLSGRVALTKGHYSPSTQFLDLRPGPTASGVRGFQLFALRESPLKDMRFDVELSSRFPFDVRNSVVSGSMRPHLRLGGTGLVPVLTGSVFLDQTFLKLPATRLELTGGTVRFNEENPFVPTVEIVCRTRMLGYDIRGTISGDYDDADVLFTSTPSLSQEDLFLLVLTGRLPEDADRNDALNTANTVAIYLAWDTVSRWFADDGPINEDNLLERVEFSYGTDVSKNGVETVDLAFRLTDKAGLPREVRNKQHLFLAGERDVYEDYNFGVRLVFRFR